MEVNIKLSIGMSKSKSEKTVVRKIDQREKKGGWIQEKTKGNKTRG